MTVAVLFMIAPHAPLTSTIASISLLFSAVLIFKAPLQGLYLLPLPLMIGPVFFFSVGGVNATVGDFYSAMLILRVISPYASRLNVAFNPRMLLGLALLLLSAMLSSDIGASFVGLTKITQFALLVWTSNILLKGQEDTTNSRWRNIFTAWALITTLCSIMMLWYLYNGQPYFLLTWYAGTGVERYEAIDLNQSYSLFRAMFFYTNIFIPIGLSLLYAVMTVLTKSEVGKFKKFLLLLSLPINAATLIANNTRSMLTPVVVLGGLAIIWFFWRALSRSKSQPKSNFLMLIIIISIMVGAVNSSSVMISASQLIVLQERTLDSSSMEARLSVWGSVISKVLDDPLRLLVVGWGPQATSRQEGEVMKGFLTGSEGNSEGAFDSTPIGFLVEYGVILTTLVFTYVAGWFFRMWRYRRKTSDTFTLTLLLMGCAILFTHIFQQFTISPPALMAMQVLAFIPVARRTQRSALVSHTPQVVMVEGGLESNK